MRCPAEPNLSGGGTMDIGKSLNEYRPDLTGPDSRHFAAAAPARNAGVYAPTWSFHAKTNANRRGTPRRDACRRC